MSSQSQSQGLGEDLYSGAASFGLIYSLIGAIVGTIVGLIMIILGISMLFKKISTVAVTAKILNVNCNTDQNNKQNCNINVSYSYNGKDMTGYIQYTGNIVYSKDQQVTVYVNNDNPSEVYFESANPKKFGGIMIVIGILIIACGWFWYWLSRKYKFLAAAEGVSGAFNILRR
jgi:hypothetical protein